jgi:hypothetical protein
MASVRSDVTHLREQYEAGKSQANQLTVHYNGKQVHDREQWTKVETQLMPKVDIQIQSDPKNPYWTLVEFTRGRQVELSLFRSWLTRMLLNEARKRRVHGCIGSRRLSKAMISAKGKLSVDL